MKFGLIGLVSHHALAELALSRTGFRSKNVSRKRVSADDLPCTGLLKTLGRTLMRFHFGHLINLIWCDSAAGAGRTAETYACLSQTAELLLEV